MRVEANGYKKLAEQSVHQKNILSVRPWFKGSIRGEIFDVSKVESSTVACRSRGYLRKSLSGCRKHRPFREGDWRTLPTVE